ncbi:MAG: NAD(P)/FAD-dependent oxidoreductase [Geminicoccaceae bacterium]
MNASADSDVPPSTEVVVIGGGVAGVTTAYYLAMAGVPVVLCEKGSVAGEQSSRNWGWIRKQRRDPRELPAITQALRLWEEIADRAPDIGWHIGGVTSLAETDQDLEGFEQWLEHARNHQIDSRMLSSSETDQLLGQSGRRFKGALTTPSDARAEPALAVPAIAGMAREHGAVVLERCAVRTLIMEAGRVSGVVTEHGPIACNTVVLAGGAWSRMMMRHLGLDLPQLQVKASVQRSTPAPLITESAIGSRRAAIRRRADGGYNITRTGATTFHITPSAFRHFRSFLPVAMREFSRIKMRFGRPFFEELTTSVRWRADEVTPFEKTRMLDPEPDHALLDDVLAAAKDLYPQLRDISSADRWAGMIDVMPDELPVLGPVASHPGLLIATGFSGHGFGSGPVAGHAMASLAQGKTLLFDLHDFRLERFVT